VDLVPLILFLDLLEAIQYLVVWRRLAVAGVRVLQITEHSQIQEVLEVAARDKNRRQEELVRLGREIQEEMALQVLEARGMQEAVVAREDLVWMRHRQVEGMAALVFRLQFLGRRCIMPVAAEVREHLMQVQQPL
jgi:hypothetical protein